MFLRMITLCTVRGKVAHVESVEDARTARASVCERPAAKSEIAISSTSVVRLCIRCMSYVVSLEEGFAPRAIHPGNCPPCAQGLEGGGRLSEERRGVTHGVSGVGERGG